MNELETTFGKCKPYAGQSLLEHFGKLIYMSEAELQREAENFLRVVATWVYRKFSGRRKGGVPMGYLHRFILPEDEEIQFTRALMVQIVHNLRRRGLREFDESRQSPTFDLLVRAYDQARRR